MEKLKYKIQQISRKEIKDTKFLKQSIFDGNIFIFKKSHLCSELINLTNKFFYMHFGIPIEDFIKNDNMKSFEENKLVEFQDKVKRSKSLLALFCKLLIELKFNVKETLTDKITFRYSPNIKKEPLGNLKPAKAHRDTWASNVFNQINWWIPLHQVEESNSIFIVPEYFNKKILNNSNVWSFKNYKKIKNYPSTPFTEFKFKKKQVKHFKLKKGEVLCFSGNHIHGSVLGLKKRINLETRTICYNDEKIFNIPKNVDSETTVKKINWFSPIRK